MRLYSNIYGAAVCGFVIISTLSLVAEAKNLTCWVCNVYTGGAGAMCYDDYTLSWHRGSCDYCMKIYTVQHNLYHRNKPIITTTVSRICAQKTQPLYKYDTCERHIGAATTSIRCWCHSNDCNAAFSWKQNQSVLSLVTPCLITLFYLIKARLW